MPAETSILTPFLDSFFLAVTYLGSGLGVVLLALLYAWWVDPAGGRRLAAVLGISFLANLALKELFALPRPYDVEPAAASEGARATATGYGFPSGHTQASAVFWFFLARLHRRRWLTALAAVMVGLVGVSRLYLGVHFPLDVLGGLAAGLVLVWVAIRAPEPPRPGPVAGTALALVALPVSVFLGPSAAQALGLALGAHLARADYPPARTRWRRLRVALGGLALLGLLYLGFDRLLAAMAATVGADPRGEAAAGYLRSLLVALVTFDLWPRAVLGKTQP